jgi:hypothetical protein
VIHVTDRSDIAVRLITVEFLFSHGVLRSLEVGYIIPEKCAQALAQTH